MSGGTSKWRDKEDFRAMFHRQIPLASSDVSSSDSSSECELTVIGVLPNSPSMQHHNSVPLQLCIITQMMRFPLYLPIIPVMSSSAAPRRCRIQARPNVSSSLRLSKRTPSAPSKQDAASTGEQKVNVEDAEKEHFETPSNPAQPTPHLPSLPTAVSTNSGCEIVSSVESTSRCATPRRRRNTSASTTSSRHRSPLKSPEVVHKTRKRFTGDEPLDPKKMTMQDMIWWNPKNDTVGIVGFFKFSFHWSFPSIVSIIHRHSKATSLVLCNV
uniref:Uncharacterized protein n=1 Tax=Ascaris lumbricoides TaxID=6252 RepID=A0A0M3INV6_ASCLU